MNKILIKGASILDSSMKEPVSKDILIADGIIQEIQSSIEDPQAEKINLPGRVICPGFIDLQAHLCEALQEIETAICWGTREALRGGYTTVCAMPDINPPLDNEGMINLIQILSKAKGCVNVIPAACTTKGMKGESLSEIGNLVRSGAGILYDAGKTISNTSLLRRVMEYTKMFSVPLFVHCEDDSLSCGGLMNESVTSAVLGLPGIPAVAEEIVVARDILMAEYLQCPVHLALITTKGSVELIRQAKKKGVRVTCGTTAHHLDLLDEDIRDFDTNYKINPPLRGAGDRCALIEGLRDGTVDSIISDHTPCYGNIKNVEFAEAPFGIIGLETCFRVCYENLVIREKLPLSLLIDKFSASPARILGLGKKGHLKKGFVADLTILDLTKKETLTEETMISRSKNTPYLGKTFSSAIDGCFVEGILKRA
ncbi:MAG: dihydroorotase [Candidatus Aureabacteria bacterium]|nr:dihydroorotase [Candidatus Auribacterota bacterium]